VRSTDFELSADAIVAAAIEIMHERGLDAVSMRSVASRLGVSPVPLYSRVGNKDALLDAVADHLLAGVGSELKPDEAWPDYARRWARELRTRLKLAPDSRLILGTRRAAYVEASRPLVEALRKGGLTQESAVQSCRLLMWATIGFVTTERRPTLLEDVGAGRLSGSDPTGVTAQDVDDLFELELGYLVDGIERSAAE
jgi:TetR/AcrR family tetracycline transcriptional repressor